MRCRRIIAAIIDIIILIFALALMLSVIPLNPKIRDGYNKIDLIENGTSPTSEKIDEINEIQYELEFEFVKYYLIFSLILIVYFIFIPKNRNNQTLGQKIMKVRLIGEGDITYNIYVIRALLNSSLSLLIILPLLLYFLSEVWYSNVAAIMILIQFVYWVVSFVMLLLTKETIHDKITKTKIIEVKR